MRVNMSANLRISITDISLDDAAKIVEMIEGANQELRRHFWQLHDRLIGPWVHTTPEEEGGER